MKAMKFLLPAAIATAMAAPASAQESASAASHYYVGATAGQGHWRSMCQNAPSCDDTNTTLGVFAGYRINPIFSAELGFRNYGTLNGGKETNYGPTYGVGVQYEINKNIALRGEWQAYPGLGGSTLPKGDLDTVSVGALWRF